MPSPEKTNNPTSPDTELSNHLKRLGVSLVVFDLDGTLRATQIEFSNGMTNATGILIYGISKWHEYQKFPEGQEYQNAKHVAEAKLLPCVIAFRDEFQVTPEIMQFATITTAKLLGLNPNDNEDDKSQVDAAILEVDRIYHPIEDVTFVGAAKTVDKIGSAGIPSILATHGDKDYTLAKLDLSPELKSKFPIIFCFQTHRPKADQWDEQFVAAGFTFPDTLFIGDNFKADLLPGIERGAKGIWVNTENKPISDMVQMWINSGSLRVTDSVTNTPNIIANW